jgi:iron complex transport system substrate-binding protein
MPSWMTPAKKTMCGIAIVAAALLAGCGREPSPPDTGRRALASQRSETPPTARRVVSLAPSITEIVYALGEGNRLVGVTSYCTYPPEAMKKPKCGGAMDTDFEKILTLRPDLILVHGQHETAAQFCRKNGIRMVRTYADDVPSLFKAVLTIGEALGCTSRAEALVSQIQIDLAKVRSAVKGRPVIKAFLSMSRSIDRLKALNTTNGDGFVSKMLEVAGGENIFAGTDVAYPKISPAELVRRQPEVIIELQPGRRLTEQDRKTMLAQWAELGNIPAVAKGRIYFVTDDYAMIPGPRVALLAKRFATLLHAGLEGKLN